MIYNIINDDCIKAMREMPANSIDAVVTDPPYELGFMGKKWDGSGVAFDIATWEEVLRVLKPGGYLLAFGHSRLFHRLAIAIEDAGFELRDTIMWVYGSGFPKSMNVSKAIEKKKGVKPIGSKPAYGAIANRELIEERGWNNINNALIMPETQTEEAKQWEGYGTALKPAYEPIVMARKPIEGTVAENVLKYGTGAINIDESRVGSETITINGQGNDNLFHGNFSGKIDNPEREGRFPANFIHDGSEEVVSLFPHTKSGIMTPEHTRHTDGSPNGIYGKYDENHPLSQTYGDEGSAARFFYQAKASKKDRDGGLGHLPDKEWKHEGAAIPERNNRPFNPSKNNHPTVKPTDLMQYLIRLVAPPGAVVLDPFMGSGSTGKAAALLNRDYTFVGIDQEEEYCQIAEARIKSAIK